MPATVAMIGLTHPHSAMYLDTLDALDAVGGIALYDQDTTTAREVAAACRKAVGVHDDLAPLLSSAEIAHALVGVPTAQSPAILVRAIEAGTPVFTEKPAARAAAEFAPVVAALDRRPVAFAIAYLNRWHPALRQLRDLYREGAIGRLMAVELRMVTTQARFRNPGHWLFRREAAGGGILSWLGCHWLDLARYLSGDEVASVAAQLATTSDEAIDVEDTAAVAFRLAGEAEGSLHAGYLLAAGAPGYEGTSYDMAVHLRGTLGTLAYYRGNAGGRSPWTASRRAGRRPRRAPSPSHNRRRGATAAAPASTPSALSSPPARATRCPPARPTRCASSKSSTPSTRPTRLAGRSPSLGDRARCRPTMRGASAVKHAGGSR